MAVAFLGLPRGGGPDAGTSDPAPVQVFAIKGFQGHRRKPLGRWRNSPCARAPYLRADATIDILQKATTTLEEALRDKDLACTVALPAAGCGDTVTLKLSSSPSAR